MAKSVGKDELKMAMELAAAKLREATGADEIIEKVMFAAGQAGPVATGTAVLAGAVVGTYVVHKAAVSTAIAAGVAAAGYYTVMSLIGPGKAKKKGGAKATKKEKPVAKL